MRAQTAKAETGEITDHVADYVNTFILSTRVKINRELIEKGSSVLGGIVVSALLLFTLFFSGIAAGWWLGDVVKSRALGFLLVGLFFLFILLGILIVKKSLIDQTRNWLVKRMYEKTNTDI